MQRLAVQLRAKYLVGNLAFLIFPLLPLYTSVYPASSQKLNEPKLVQVWVGGEDYGESLDNVAGELSGYVKENPNGKAVVRICSGEKMTTALVSSVGFPFYFFEAMRSWDVPASNIYLARSALCRRKSKATFHEFWFVPQGSSLQADEIIPAERMAYTRLYVSYYKNEESPLAKKEFADKTRRFIDELKDNPAAEGFIVTTQSNRFINSNIRRALRRIEKDDVAASRIRVVRKGIYDRHYPDLEKDVREHYPEFMTVTIKE
jgi:hypothetical protein